MKLLLAAANADPVAPWILALPTPSSGLREEGRTDARRSGLGIAHWQRWAGEVVDAMLPPERAEIRPLCRAERWPRGTLERRRGGRV